MNEIFYNSINSRNRNLKFIILDIRLETILEKFIYYFYNVTFYINMAEPDYNSPTQNSEYIIPTCSRNCPRNYPKNCSL